MILRVGAVVARNAAVRLARAGDTVDEVCWVAILIKDKLRTAHVDAHAHAQAVTRLI